jgi:hypothetical protein
MSLRAILLGSLLFAQPLSPKEALHRLLSAKQPKKSWFSEVFLKEVSLPQIEAILRGFSQTYGRYVTTKGKGNPYEVEYEQAFLLAYIKIDEEGRIASLLFRSPQRKFASWAALLDTLRQRKESISVLVRKGNTDVVALQPDTPLAVGSTFKVAVLAALLKDIQAGRRRWEEVITLDSAWRSLPSGRLQEWPTGAPLTLYTLAALMISESDNTATDALISLIGREKIEQISPRNRPFLCTGEFFRLLWLPQGKDLREKWLSISIEERRKGVEALSHTSLQSYYDQEVVSASIPPSTLQATWLFTLREIDTLFQQVERLPLMHINPGVALREEWKLVAYKGGSYPGAYNLSTMAYTPQGERWFVGMTWNSLQGIDTDAFHSLYTSMLRLAAEESK